MMTEFFFFVSYVFNSDMKMNTYDSSSALTEQLCCDARNDPLCGARLILMVKANNIEPSIHKLMVRISYLNKSS